MGWSGSSSHLHGLGWGSLKHRFFLFLSCVSFFPFADTAGNTRAPSRGLDSHLEAAWRLPGWAEMGWRKSQDPKKSVSPNRTVLEPATHPFLALQGLLPLLTEPAQVAAWPRQAGVISSFPSSWHRPEVVQVVPVVSRNRDCGRTRGPEWWALDAEKHPRLRPKSMAPSKTCASAWCGCPRELAESAAVSGACGLHLRKPSALY